MDVSSEHGAHGGLLGLQRNLGNRAFTSLLQAKLEMSTPGDAHEQEADRIAEQVTSSSSPKLQRACSSCGPEETPRIMTKRAPGGSEPALHASHGAVTGPGEPLAAQVRSDLEPRFGQDFSNVRVHRDAAAASAAQSIGALAYTVGNHMVFGRGQYQPGTQAGRRLLAHELTHVVQQRGGAARLQRKEEPRGGTKSDRREFIRTTITFLEAAARQYGMPKVSLSAATFDRSLDSWYTMVIDRQKMIEQDGGDPELTTNLRAAYIAAIRALIKKRASDSGYSEAELYRVNSGRIPLWALLTPHHMVRGISTPIADGQRVDRHGQVHYTVNGIKVTVLPDLVSTAPKLAGDTSAPPISSAPGYRFENRGKQQIVSEISGRAEITVNLQTRYRPGVNPDVTSAYGRGTTSEDVAGAAVDPRSSKLRFHEGSHGLAFEEYMATHPPPQFKGRVGMTVQDFLQARKDWQSEVIKYGEAMRRFSEQKGDCVGTPSSDPKVCP